MEGKGSGEGGGWAERGVGTVKSERGRETMERYGDVARQEKERRRKRGIGRRKSRRRGSIRNKGKR